MIAASLHTPERRAVRIVGIARRAPVVPAPQPAVSEAPLTAAVLYPHFRHWIASLAFADVSRFTVQDYRFRVNKFLGWMERQDLVLDGPTFGGYRDAMLRDGYRPKTVSADMGAIRRFVVYLGENTPVKAPNLEAYKRPRRDPMSSRYVVTDDDVVALFAAAARLPATTAAEYLYRCRTLVILALLAFTGVRHHELLSIKVSDIQQGPNGYILLVRAGKGGEQRQLPLNEDCLKLLFRWLEVRAEWLEGVRNAGHQLTREVESGLLPHCSTRLMAQNGLLNMFRRLRSIAGMENKAITPHCLRAWFITTAARYMDIPTASKLAGHASIQTTLEHYLKTDAHKMRTAVSGISIPSIRDVEERPLQSSRYTVPAVIRENSNNSLAARTHPDITRHHHCGHVVDLRNPPPHDPAQPCYACGTARNGQLWTQIV